LSQLPESSFVSCYMRGQIGNQLFIIATTLSYAWNHGAIPLFPKLNSDNKRCSINKDRLFFRLDTSNVPRAPQYLFNHEIWHQWEEIPVLPDLVLCGHFISWKFFHHHREKILQLFAPSELTLRILHEKYSDLIACPNTVAVHVRTKDRNQHDNQTNLFIGLEYYRQAIHQFSEDSLFVVFSDRIEWCKKHFPPIGRKFVFIDGNYGIEDMFLMSKMRNLIMSDSTLSWWAAYMASNCTQRILIPDYWGGSPTPSLQPKDIIFPGWEIMQVPPFESYPPDMLDYETASCDN
jgi:hypothetical protein